MIYAAETFAGAMLEVLVNANIGRPPRQHAWIEISIPRDVAVEQLDSSELLGWDAPDQIARRKSATNGITGSAPWR